MADKKSTSHDDNAVMESFFSTVKIELADRVASFTAVRHGGPEVAAA